jgi:hypothetical protein
LHAKWETVYNDPPFTADDLKALSTDGNMKFTTQNPFLIRLK